MIDSDTYPKNPTSAGASTIRPGTGTGLTNDDLAEGALIMVYVVAAKTLAYTGQDQALIEEGMLESGPYQYALGVDHLNAPIEGWSEQVRTATREGTHYVWYRDADDTNAQPDCICVTISRGADSSAAPRPSAHPTQPTVPDSAWRPYGSTSSYSTGGSTSSGSGPASSSSKASRLAGSDRYATSAALSSAAFTSSDWAVVATGSSFPDALAASAIAGAHSAPVVLTDGSALSSAAKTELTRLGVTHAVVVGGAAAVSDAVLAEVEALGASASRVSGLDRCLTALDAFRAVGAADASSDTVVVASGQGFADALSIGPWAWAKKVPVLLARPDGTLPDEAVAALAADAGITRVVIVGGQAAVPDTIRSQLGDGYAYERVGGADRYETSRLVAEFAVRNGMSWRNLGIATGRDFPDALAASPLIGSRGGVLLLIDGQGAAVTSEVRSHASAIGHVLVLGGSAAVPDALVDSLAGLLP